MHMKRWKTGRRFRVVLFISLLLAIVMTYSMASSFYSYDRPFVPIYAAPAGNGNVIVVEHEPYLSVNGKIIVTEIGGITGNQVNITFQNGTIVPVNGSYTILLNIPGKHTSEEVYASNLSQSQPLGITIYQNVSMNTFANMHGAYSFFITGTCSIEVEMDGTAL